MSHAELSVVMDETAESFDLVPQIINYSADVKVHFGKDLYRIIHVYIDEEKCFIKLSIRT